MFFSHSHPLLYSYIVVHRITYNYFLHIELYELARIPIYSCGIKLTSMSKKREYIAGIISLIASILIIFTFFIFFVAKKTLLLKIILTLGL
ncbi:MAG: hypothetical protein DRN04_08700 [Thermoprotei archaeon]|nr:MAG: hypothetical protein DRN04_08700 [Thermoprotei archaeon]